jgi:hypothetical protein
LSSAAGMGKDLLVGLLSMFPHRSVPRPFVSGGKMVMEVALCMYGHAISNLPAAVSILHSTFYIL